MRRRLPLQVRNTCEACFICSSRHRHQTLALLQSSSSQAKTYHSTVRSQKPAQAAAARSEEDEEEDTAFVKPTATRRWQPPVLAQQENYNNATSRSWDSSHNNEGPQRSRFQHTPQRQRSYREQPDTTTTGRNNFRSRDNRDSGQPAPLFRRVAFNGPNLTQRESRPPLRSTDDFAAQPRERRPAYTFGEQRIRRNDEPKEKAANPTGTDSEISTDAAEVSMPFSELDDLERRKQQNVRRSRRQDRFEVEEEPEVKRSQPSSARLTPTASWKSREHDFEMMEAEEALYGGGRQKKKKKQRSKKDSVNVPRPRIQIPEFVRVDRLAQMMKSKTEDLVNKLEEEGFEGARYDHLLDLETSTMFADLYGFDIVTTDTAPLDDLTARPPPEDMSSLPPRPPIVTIMGHVDHGKTTILDWLRKSSVVAGEHGGITQHIGAFSVTMPGSERQITFLDTPGHEAFLDMRKRGANVTDIVVLVVAADDSVKPQTVEAIKHALEAKVNIIVAINKIDKEDANIDKVKLDLTRHEIVVEDYGGEYQAIPLSGKTGRGMEELEEAIITLSDVLDFRAEQDGPAEGTIIESKVTNAGRVATILVRRGTLRPGDFIVAGNTWARVRTLRNDAGQVVDRALPGDPVQVDGWRGCDPTAGLEVLQAENESHAKEVVDLRLELAETAQTSAHMTTINATRTQEAEARAKVLEWEKENKISRRRRDNEGWVDAVGGSGPKQVHLVIKADVAGSVEAIVSAVSAIGNHEVQANVIHSGTGPLAESDIRILATSGEVGYAISFNQPVDGQMFRLAEMAGLSILDHNVIYKVTDDVKAKVEDALPPLVTQRVLGEAQVGQIFDVTVKKKKLRIAGCTITNGTISRANKVRVLRKGDVVYTGMLESLKNVKRDVTEMRKGSECGMGFENWEDFQEGDQIQCFEEKEEKRKLY